MDRQQQLRRIRLFRRGIVGLAVTGALGTAGLLGLQHTAAATTDTGTDTGSTSGTGTSTSGSDDSWGPSVSGDLTGGSGASHATTAGS